MQIPAALVRTHGFCPLQENTHVNVLPFSETYQALTGILIASGVAMVWECPKTPESFLLILSEALYFRYVL
jgi:hypothetical protein